MHTAFKPRPDDDFIGNHNMSIVRRMAWDLNTGNTGTMCRSSVTVDFREDACGPDCILGLGLGLSSNVFWDNQACVAVNSLCSDKRLIGIS